jgi:hypothetical protein
MRTDPQPPTPRTIKQTFDPANAFRMNPNIT